MKCYIRLGKPSWSTERDGVCPIEEMKETVVEEKRSEKTLRDVYYVLFRHKRRMILFFIVVIATVTVGTLRRPNIYRSEAKLLVRLGRESVTLDPTATTGQIINISESRQMQINSELEILKSHEIAEKLVDAMGPVVVLNRPDQLFEEHVSADRNATEKAEQDIQTEVKRRPSLLERLGTVEPPNDHEAAVLTVMKNLKVEVLKDSSIIDMSYEAQNPKLAHDVLAKLIDLYLEKHIAVYQTPGSYKFFIQQAEDLQDKITQAENELRTIKDKTGISSIEDQRKVIFECIGVLQQEVRKAEAALTSSESKVQALQQTLAKTPELVVTVATVGLQNYAADLMRNRLYELQLQEQNLLSKFEPSSRQVQEIRRQIAEAQALLDNENKQRAQLTKGTNITYQEMQSELLSEQANLSSLKTEVQVLNKQFAEAQAELKTLNDAEVRIMRLKREMAIQEENYRKYSENLEQARIDDALEARKISNISVVQPATLSIRPIGPKRLLHMSLGLLLGIFGATGLAFFSEYLDHSIKTPEEVQERLQLPTFASIPRVHADRGFLTAIRRKKAKPNSEIVNNASAPWNMPANLKDHYEALTEQLLLHHAGSAEVPRTLAIMGCYRGEGASTVTANLAAMLAQHRGGNILLVDADISHPSVHRIFQTRLSPGLADILANGKSNGDTISPSPVHNLHILPAGFKNTNLSEMLNSNEFTKLLNSLKNRYSFVLIDMQALSETNSAIRLASLCDGVVLVVEAERLRWEVAQRTKEQLIESNANVLGVVINKRQFHIPNWLYRTL